MFEPLWILYSVLSAGEGLQSSSLVQVQTSSKVKICAPLLLREFSTLPTPPALHRQAVLLTLFIVRRNQRPPSANLLGKPKERSKESQSHFSLRFPPAGSFWSSTMHCPGSPVTLPLRIAAPAFLSTLWCSLSCTMPS